MPFSVGFLEVIKFVVPGSVWLAIALLGPWDVPNDISERIGDNELLAAVGLVIMSYIVGNISTPISFRMLDELSRWRFTLDGHRVRRRVAPGWPFDAQFDDEEDLVRRIDPTTSSDMVAFHSQFRRRDSEGAMDGERVVTYYRIALESYSPGLAAEARYREAEINLPGALFLPATTVVLLSAGVWIADVLDGSFNDWVLVAGLAGAICAGFALRVFQRLRLEEVRFLYRAFYACAPRNADGVYRPGRVDDRPGVEHRDQSIR